MAGLGKKPSPGMNVRFGNVGVVGVFTRGVTGVGNAVVVEVTAEFAMVLFIGC